jgi:cell division control protein 7
MSALRGVPAGVFELKRSSSGQGLQAAKERYASEEEDRRTSQGERPHGESEYEEEEEVDETVREDMSKLEDTFPGISERFRLINRIGEGIVYFISLKTILNRND